MTSGSVFIENVKKEKRQLEIFLDKYKDDKENPMVAFMKVELKMKNKLLEKFGQI